MNKNILCEISNKSLENVISSMEEDEQINDIINICTNLVLTKKITNKQLYKRITETITNAVKDLEPVEILYNDTYGSFSISDEYINYCNNIKNMNIKDRYQVGRGKKTINNIKDFGKYLAKNNPEEFQNYSFEDNEIDTYLEYGLKKASSNFCDLKLVKIPQYSDWYIHEYDGLENVILY
jgi:hypothetical protein